MQAGISLTFENVEINQVMYNVHMLNLHNDDTI
jgi:hypothetical protein